MILKVSLFLLVFMLSSCSHLVKIGKQGSLRNKKNCDENSSTQIVNGKNVSDLNLLAKEAVMISIKSTNKTVVCSGVPITNDIILTAAHCLYGVDKNSVKILFSTRGDCLDEADSASKEKVFGVKKILLHESFDGKADSHADLALIKLEADIPKNYKMAKFFQNSHHADHDEAVILGYGITGETSADSMVLRTTTKKIKTDFFIKEKIILIDQRNSSGGICRGDSGGPIYVTVNGTKELIGINSFNVGTEKNKECHTAGVAMYIPFFSNWIKLNSISL